MSQVDLFISRIGGAQVSGGGYKAKCPSHDDNEASLSIGTGDDGKLLLSCKANKGCTFESILESVGLTSRDLKKSGLSPSDPPRPKNKPDTRSCFSSAESAINRARKMMVDKGYSLTGKYEYQNAKGETVFIQLRFDSMENGSKQFRPVHFESHKGKWFLQGHKGDRPLYNLPQLAKAKKIVVVEGEKAADALNRIGIVATTSSNGSKSPGKTDWSPLLEKEIYVWPDNDEPGERYATAIMSIISDKSTKISFGFHVVKDENRPSGYDAADMVEALEGKGYDKARIRKQVAEYIKSNSILSTLELPKPFVFDFQPPDVKKFDKSWLPDALQDWSAFHAEAREAPIDYIAISSLGCLSGLVGSKIRVMPVKDWYLCPNMWGMVVGRPGTNKTSMMGEPIDICNMIENEAIDHYERQKKKYDEAVEEAKRIKKANKSEDIDVDLPEEPKEKRLVVNEATVAGILSVMQRGNGGIIIACDELASFLNTIQSDYQKNGVEFYLETWTGGKPRTVDRSGDKTVRVKDNTLAIMGGIQPSKFSEFCIHQRRVDDGFLNRFQLMCWPDHLKSTGEEKESIDPEVVTRATNCFTRVHSIDGDSINARENDKGHRYLEFDPEARELWFEWRKFNAERKNAFLEDEVADFIVSHLSKMDATVASLALIIQLADFNEGPICVNSLNKAIWINDYLESHFRRALFCSDDVDKSDEYAMARRLAEGLLDGDFSEVFCATDIHKKRWKLLNSSAKVNAAIQTLLEYNWIFETCDKDLDPGDLADKRNKQATYYQLSPYIKRDSDRIRGHKWDHVTIDSFVDHKGPEMLPVKRHDINFSQFKARQTGNFNEEFADFGSDEQYI